MFTLYSANCTGQANNCLYPHPVTITDEAALAAAVGRDYVCAQYLNSYRTNDNFIGSDCLPVDCDNDHSENPGAWVTPADVQAAFPGITFAVLYFGYRNHTATLHPSLQPVNAEPKATH